MAWVEAVRAFACSHRGAKRLEHFLEDEIGLVLFVGNFVENDRSHVWKLDHRKESPGLFHLANGSILGNDIVDISGKVSSRSATLDLLVKRNNSVNLVKGHLSPVTLFNWSRCILGDLLNLVDGVGNLSNLVLRCSFATMFGLN